MRLTERQIRKIVREMALKSYNVLPSDESLGSEDVPLGYAEEKFGINSRADYDGSISYTPAAGDPRAGIYISKTYGQPGYRSTVARQYGKIPFPVNIFVLPSISALDQGITSYRGTMRLVQKDLESGTYSYDDSPILDLLERIQPGCTSVIEPGDATLIIQPAGAAAGSAEEMQVMDTRGWRQGDGVYLALHALYEAGGPMSSSMQRVEKPYKELLDLLQYAGYDSVPLGEALVRILRVRTLRDAFRMQKASVARGEQNSGPPSNDTEVELLVVANLIGKSPVNLNTFPTTRPDGEPLAEDLVLRGNEAIQALHDEVGNHVGEVLYPGMITISCPYGRPGY